jgi:hypothetical protein
MLLQIFAAIGFDESWLNLIPEELRLIFPLILFFVNLIALAIVLYLAGLIVVGKKRDLVSDAFIVSLLGNILSTAFFILIPIRLLALALSIIVWLLLIKRFYETTWPKAMAVGILAIIVFLAITVVLALIFGILAVILERFFLLAVIPTP